VTSFNGLPFWKRAFLINAVAIVGVFIGFASAGVQLPTILKARIAVFTIALMNFMLLVVRPRIISQKNKGEATAHPWSVAYQVLTERPFVVALLILQLLGVSRATAASIVFVETSTSAYVRGMANAQSMSLRLMGAAVLMGGVAALWMLGAVGLWRSRPWAWWLVLVLNGLAAAISCVLQVLKPDEFLLDPAATTAVVLLLIRSVRTEFRGGQTANRLLVG
jgi:uncharacterized membrane protein (DUF2068 family)